LFGVSEWCSSVPVATPEWTPGPSVVFFASREAAAGTVEEDTEETELSRCRTLHKVLAKVEARVSIGRNRKVGDVEVSREKIVEFCARITVKIQLEILDYGTIRRPCSSLTWCQLAYALGA